MKVTRRSNWPSNYGEKDTHPEYGKVGKIISYSDDDKLKYGVYSDFIDE